MEDQDQSKGGTEDQNASGTSGEGQENKDQKPDQGDEKAEYVPKSAYQKVSDDMHKYKRELNEVKARLDKEAADRLASEKNFEQLWKNEKKRADEAEELAKKKDSYYVHTQKVSAIRAAAMEAGLRSEAMDDLELLDFDGVEVELTSNGRYLVHGAKEFAQSIKNKKPHWFKSGKPPGHNAGGGGGTHEGSKAITPKDVVDAERSWKSGKISKDDYVKVFNDYRTQKVKTN